MRPVHPSSKWWFAVQGAGRMVFLLAAAHSLAAQEVPALEHLPQGFRLSAVSIYSSFDSSPLPSNIQAGNPGYDFSVGASATVAWTRIRPRYNMAFSYSPSYYGDLTRHTSRFDPLNQTLSLTIGRKLAPNWSFTGGLAASVMTTSEFLFQPNQFGKATQAASTADQLATLVLGGGSYDNTQLASLITGAPLLESAARRQFFGDWILNSSFQAGATYNKSRLSVSLTTGASHTQALSTPQNTSTPLVHAADTGTAGVSVSYALSPRTQIGVSLAGNRTFSSFEDIYSSSVSAHVGRRMSMRWAVDLHAGTGLFNSHRSLYALPAGPQYLAGGSLSFKTASHAFLFSADRNLSDPYGLGASSLLITSAGWNWGPRTGRWRINASGGIQQIHQQLPGSGPQDVTGWQGSVGFTQTLTRAMALNLMYAYVRNSNQIAGLPADWTTQGVRLGLVWTP